MQKNYTFFHVSGHSATMSTSSNTSNTTAADDLVSRMLNDLDMSKGDAKNSPGGISQQQQQPMNSMSKTRPNYNVNVSSFASKPNLSGSVPNKSNVQAPKMKVTTNTFGDLLGKNAKNLYFFGSFWGKKCNFTEQHTVCLKG